MKRVISRFFFFSFLIINGFKLSAQVTPVLPQDSLALVAFYNSTGGSTWFEQTNWLTGPVSSWAGVAVVGNRVQTLALPYNNLMGTIPDEFCDLSGLEYIYLNNNSLSGGIPACIGNAVSINSIDLSHNTLSGAFPAVFATAMPNLADIWISNNQFTDFPDLRGVPELSNLAVDSNWFTFEDLLPNASIPNLGYTYAQQTTVIQSGPDVILNALDPFSLSITIGGTGNVYQWQQNFQDVTDGVRFSGTTTNTISNSAAERVDEGFYTVVVTNPALPLLSIRVVSLRVQVTDNRFAQSLNYPRDTVVYCGPDSLLFRNASDQGLPLTYDIINPIPLYADINSNQKVHAIARGGTQTFLVHNNGNTSFAPFQDTIRIAVSTHHTIPTFTINNDLPIYAGEELSLSVDSIEGVNYKWTTPSAQVFSSSSISIPHADSTSEGIYRLRISEGACLYDTLQISVALAVDSSIVIYELITPNGDGDNETFYIKNIETLPSAHVTVFNVWHQVVYNQSHYKNDWNGGGLPVGTYYYLVKVEEWEKIYKGNLYIKR